MAAEVTEAEIQLFADGHDPVCVLLNSRNDPASIKEAIAQAVQKDARSIALRLHGRLVNVPIDAGIVQLSSKQFDVVDIVPATSNAGAGEGALQFGAMMAALKEMREENNEKLTKLLIQKTTKSVKFSDASATIACNVADALCIGSGGRLDLPDLTPYRPAVDLAPFQWFVNRKELKENDVAPDLLRMVDHWVRNGSNPPITNLFVDVRSEASRPIVLEVPGVALLRGVPDAAFLKPRVRSQVEAPPLAGSSEIFADWKRYSVFTRDRGQVSAIARVQALAVARCTEYRQGQPIVFTDASTGFRFWIVIGSRLYYLHPDDNDLSLSDGVALIRLFLSKGEHGLEPAVEGEGRSARLVFLPSAGAAQPGPAQLPASSGSGASAAAGSGGAVGKSKAGGRSRAPGLISKGNSPEGAADADDLDTDDLETVCCAIAAAMEDGGGFDRRWLNFDADGDGESFDGRCLTSDSDSDSDSSTVKQLRFLAKGVKVAAQPDRSSAETIQSDAR